MRTFILWLAIAMTAFAFGWTVGGHFDGITILGAIAAVVWWRMNRKQVGHVER